MTERKLRSMTIGRIDILERRLLRHLASGNWAAVTKTANQLFELRNTTATPQAYRK